MINENVDSGWPAKEVTIFIADLFKIPKIICIISVSQKLSRIYLLTYVFGHINRSGILKV